MSEQPTTDPMSLPQDVKRKLLAARDALEVGDVMEAHHQIYSIAAPHFDKLAHEVWTALETPRSPSGASGNLREGIQRAADILRDLGDSANAEDIEGYLTGSVSPEPSERPVVTVNGDGEATEVTWRGEKVWTCGKLSAPFLRAALKECRAELAALKSPPEPGGGQWQPIETAPHDSGKALVLSPNGFVYVASMQFGMWRTHPGDWTVKGATHWMPLPELPRFTSTKECNHMARVTEPHKGLCIYCGVSLNGSGSHG